MLSVMCFWFLTAAFFCCFFSFLMSLRFCAFRALLSIADYIINICLGN